MIYRMRALLTIQSLHWLHIPTIQIFARRKKLLHCECSRFFMQSKQLSIVDGLRVFASSSLVTIFCDWTSDYIQPQCRPNSLPTAQSFNSFTIARMLLRLFVWYLKLTDQNKFPFNMSLFFENNYFVINLLVKKILCILRVKSTVKWYYSTY